MSKENLANNLNMKTLLKKPLLVNCFKCSQLVEVKFNPRQGKYVQKNHWYYWTGKKNHQKKYICDACLVYLYRKDRWTYLENITDQGRRRVLRTYIYAKK